jgi:hypothetical protein
MPKTKSYWVTRGGRDRGKGIYELWASKPMWRGRYWWNYRGCLTEFCSHQLEQLTDIRLKGGPRSIVEIHGFKAVRV